MELEFKPDFEAAKPYWLAFWEKELLDRPCCLVRCQRDGVEPVPGPPYMAGSRGDLQAAVDQIVAHCATVWWGGDAMPSHSPSFGPDMMSAWLGADLEFDDREYGTNWVVPCIGNWDESLPITLDTDNAWWQRMLTFCRLLAEAFEGKMLIAHLDLHSGMDALSAMRTPETLCFDMMDVPDTIDQAVNDLNPVYEQVYQGLYDAAQMQRYGTCGWVPAYHPVRTNTIQCDFAALIGPDHFKRFVIPGLEYEAALLGHCVYHYDGPECLVHLDDICSIDGLDCIQWTTGARNRNFIEWMDLLKKIQAKGVSLWVPCNAESIKIFHRELDPRLLFYDCRVQNQKQGEEILKWLVANT